MTVPTEEDTRQPETKLPIATEEDDGWDSYLAELPLEKDPEETALEEEPAAPADDQASFDTFAAMSGLPHDLSARRPDHFFLRLLFQEIVTLGVLALAVLALAHFNVWRFPLLTEEFGKVLGIELPASLKVRLAASATQRARAPATLAGRTLEHAQPVAPGTRTPGRASKRLDAPPSVLPDRFGMFVEGSEDHTSLQERECFAGLGNQSAVSDLMAHIRATSMFLPRALRNRPTFLLYSRIIEPERLELFDVDTCEHREGTLHLTRRSVTAAPIQDHPYCSRIEVPYDLAPGTYALGIMRGYYDAGTHWFWPFRVE